MDRRDFLSRLCAAPIALCLPAGAGWFKPAGRSFEVISYCPSGRASFTPCTGETVTFFLYGDGVWRSPDGKVSFTEPALTLS